MTKKTIDAIKHLSINGVNNYILHLDSNILDNYIEYEYDSFPAIIYENKLSFGNSVYKGEVHIYLNSLDLITSKGIANIQGLIHTDNLDIDLKGIGDIYLKGRIGNLNINSSGAGNIDVLDLKADTVKAKIKGTGNLKAFSFKKADIEISGISDVYIDLNGDTSELNQKILGLGKIKKINSTYITHTPLNYFDDLKNKINNQMNLVEEVKEENKQDFSDKNKNESAKNKLKKLL